LPFSVSSARMGRLFDTMTSRIGEDMEIAHTYNETVEKYQLCLSSLPTGRQAAPFCPISSHTGAELVGILQYSSSSIIHSESKLNQK